MGSTVGAIGIKHEFFSQLIIERSHHRGKDKEIHVDKHIREKPYWWGAIFNLPWRVWVLYFAGGYLGTSTAITTTTTTPPSWVLQTVISMICADMAARRVME